MLTLPNLFGEHCFFRHFVCCKNRKTTNWLPGLGSNQRMADSKSAALPLGYRAMRFTLRQYSHFFCQRARSLFPGKDMFWKIRYLRVSTDNIGKSCFFKNLFISSRKNSFVPQAISFSKGNKLSYDQSFHGSSQT